MTSYTRKLHEVAPAAAQAIHRQELRDYRYGKSVTLACFAPEAHGVAPAKPSFGKRECPPVLPAYECWVPELLDHNGKKYPKAVLRAVSSFEARRQYAAHYNVSIVEIAARLMGQA